MIGMLRVLLVWVLVTLCPVIVKSQAIPCDSTTGLCTTLSTCQGGSYSNALGNCPDNGAQANSNGGNVTIFVMRATNLPNRDLTGPSAYLSDPYIKLTAGNVVSRSSVIVNNLNPDWGYEPVNLGVLGSATEILVEIWDSDSGLEFSDDLLARAKIRVPFCSTFHANVTSVDCGKPFGCSSEDSMWQMPARQTCLESGVISFVSAHSRCDSPLSICFYFEVQIVPFTMDVDLVYTDATLQTPVLSVLGPIPTSGGAPWQSKYSFGKPFIGQSGDVVTSFTGYLTSGINGALMLRTNYEDKYYGAPDVLKFYASVNFPATIYVCRDTLDIANGVPTWIENQYDSTNITITQFEIFGSGTSIFGCYFIRSPGTTKNKWGGVIKDVIPFYSNTFSPLYKGSKSDDAKSFHNMYVVLAVPHVVAPRSEVVTIIYDSGAFIDAMFTYGFIWWIYVYLVINFLSKIDFKIERINTYVVNRVQTGEDKSCVATLFSGYGNTPCNIEFRSRLFHTRNVYLFLLLVPFLLLISWGFSVVAVVSPTGLGFMVVFLGCGALLFWHGFNVWATNSWRLTPLALLCQGGAVVLFLCYIISVIFVDQAVTAYNKPLNFAALSLVFGTINLFPLILLVFEKDQSRTKNLKLFMDKLYKACKVVKATQQANEDGGVSNEVVPFNDESSAANSTIKNQPKKQKPLSANKLLHALLGSTYTINPNFSMFKYAAVVQETKQEDPEADASLAANIRAGSVTEIGKGHELYNTSLFILFIYLMIGVSRTAYPSLAFLNCLALIILDFLHYNLNNGIIKWPPEKKILVLVAGRLLIMGSTNNYWLLNYSLAYVVYAFVLIRDSIGSSLPMLTKREAGALVFSAVEDSLEKNYDMAASAEFAFSTLTFAFIAVIVVSALGNEDNALPVDFVPVWRAKWQPYVFGLIAVCITLCMGLFMAMIRAFYLQKHGLLRGWARTNFMIKKDWNIPVVFAVLTEIAIVTSGILIYGATQSSFILISCIFFPAIAVCFAHSANEWLKNDFELIVWPPREDDDGDKHDAPSDLDVAFNMIENVFGKDVNILPDDDAPETETGRTLKGFKLPALEAMGTKTEGMIKMPALPLKSVLRRKRQAMGIKVKQPLVKDLKPREDAVDIDRFGNDIEDVIDIADPWAQFEPKEVKQKKKATHMVTVQADRVGWFTKNAQWEAVKAKFLSYKSGQYIARKWTEFWESCRAKTKKYVKIYVTPKKKREKPAEGEEGDVEEEELSEEDEEEKNLVDSSIPMAERLHKMPFWTAAAYGFLTRKEYITLASFFGGLFLVMFMGIALAGTATPLWYGHVIWAGVVMGIFTLVPVVKYFNTYVVDDTMRYMWYFVLVFHIVFSACFFGAGLHGDIHIKQSLWILDYFFYMPAFLYLMIEGIRWVDDGFVVMALDQDGDNDVTIAEYLEYFKAYPILLAMMIILIWQLFLWINYLVGEVMVILLLAVGIGYIFVRDWAINDHYLSPELQVAGNMLINLIMFLTMCIAVFSSTNPIFALSVFFFTFIVKCTLRITATVLALDSDTMWYFSPYIFPIYSFDARHNDVVDQSQLGRNVLYALLAGACWGASLATFLYPVHVGIAVACAFLLVIAAIIASAMSYIPSQLGRYSALLTEESIVTAASAATTIFYERTLPAPFERPNWENDTPVEVEDRVKSFLDRQKERTALDIGIDIIQETRALTHIKDDSDYVNAQTLSLEEDDNEKKSWLAKYWSMFKEQVKSLIEMIPMSKSEYKRHSYSLFTISDAVAESLITGKGPYGFLGCEGLWYRLFKRAQQYPRLEFLNTKWLNVYDEFGNSSEVTQLSEPMDLAAMLRLFPDYDKAMNYTYLEESRCAVHFLMLLMSVADSRLQRETVLFQKFLRENRFRLASNGISPPSAIFSSSSYYSIDIPLVAVWLSTLSDEERERFHALKATFSEEQTTRDEAIDADDYQFAYDAMILKNEREMREHDLHNRLRSDIQRVQMQKVYAFSETLSGYEAKIFELKQDIWLRDADCFVEDKNLELYNKFRNACMNDNDELTEYARQKMGEIEAAQIDCRVGEYGRVYQFVDSDFLPGDVSVGSVELSDQILGWRCSPGINDSIQLFEGGTDPDDVEIGIFKDNWLLSALSMLAAGDGVGDGKVDDQIRNLFMGHYDMNGEVTFHTELGGYCVRLYKCGVWHPIWMDDLFPMVKRAKWSNENRGIAAAHSKECRELWVSLVEKAYAKYMGCYAELARGYVHHALQELTGCESECIPIAFASRGTGKRPLWDMLIRYRKNGYIVGAGTGASKLADKEMQDMGIAFNAAYTIYDVKAIDGYQLIKLRNPPGWREEWKGDWSDKSKLWSRRLKHKYGWVDADDHTFFMSFDDFCNVFRYLYICKWYDPSVWHSTQFPGFWKKANEVEEAEKVDMERLMMMDASDPEGQAMQIAESKPKKKEKKKDKEKAQIDTAGGMPTIHNPGCVLENNPHYTLHVFRTTDIRIVVTQADSRGRTSDELFPVSIFIVRNAHHKIPMRLKELNKDNIEFRTAEPKADRSVYLYATLKPGFYLIFVPLYLKGMEGHFTLNVMSNYKVGVHPLWPPKWMLREGGKTKNEKSIDSKMEVAKERIDVMTKWLQGMQSALIGQGNESDDEDDDDRAVGESSKKRIDDTLDRVQNQNQ
jgi:hypothetical protein